MRIRCPSCGAEIEDIDQFCYRCGAELRPGVVITAKPPPPGYAPPPPYAPMPPTPATRPPRPPMLRPVEYAGFWRRLGASMVDGLILMLVELGILLVLGLLPWGVSWLLGYGGGWPWWPWSWLSSWWPFGWFWLLSFVVSWLYFAGSECSSAQATPGKKALGLIVSNLDRERISFGRATARYFSKLLSELTLYIGYVMIGFTAKKQGLHDMIAGTLVFKVE
jgi:uncharacterized RDD family membrane protein YckC